MGIGNDGLRAENERDAANACADALRGLLSWERRMGGFEAACWDAARAALDDYDRATSPITTCPACNEHTPVHDIAESTYQQWRCVACGSWNDWPADGNPFSAKAPTP